MTLAFNAVTGGTVYEKIAGVWFAFTLLAKDSFVIPAARGNRILISVGLSCAYMPSSVLLKISFNSLTSVSPDLSVFIGTSSITSVSIPLITILLERVPNDWCMPGFRFFL